MKCWAVSLPCSFINYCGAHLFFIFSWAVMVAIGYLFQKKSELFNFSTCDLSRYRDRERNVGFISCRVCLEDFQTNINYLSEPIDVYSDWIDACEQANRWDILLYVINFSSFSRKFYQFFISWIAYFNTIFIIQ